MKAYFSPAAVALAVFGTMMLVGFAPLGIVLLLAAGVIQSRHARRRSALRSSRAARARDKAMQTRLDAARSLR